MLAFSEPSVVPNSMAGGAAMQNEARVQPVLDEQPAASQEAPVTAQPALTIAQLGKPVPPPTRGGIWYHWGPQAWIDMFMSNSMIVKKAGPLIPYTFIPILRMTTDRNRIDSEWAEIRSRREKVRLFDSPRERWRKGYGNFVREVEWALLELRKHFSQAQYEDIVVGTSVALGRENSASFIEMMNGMSDTKPSKKQATKGTGKPSRIQKMMFSTFNPAGFLTGPAEITEFDPAGGSATMYIPDCAWHICGSGESLPNPDALPEQGCLLICKGAFEELFKGEGGGLKMEFEPHLPETSCTARMTWKVQ
jgi:hypothetical protein